MTPVSSANSATALSILQRINQSSRTGSKATSNASVTVLGPLESIGNASKQAVATIVAIINDGGMIDLSSYGNANAVVSAVDNATIITGDGDDSVSAQNYATIRTGKGNDGVSAYGYAMIDAGEGDDAVGAYAYATVNAGGGDDIVDVYGHSNVDAGEGDDWVHAYAYSTVNGGGGNDILRTYDYSNVDAGEGDDFVVTLGNSKINGGSGNDTLVVSSRRSDADSTFDNATVDGGDGDDYIQVNANSTVSGGTGNDTIRILGDGTTVNFGKGDGADVIGIGKTDNNSWANTRINISGYSADDVIVTSDEAGTRVGFKGSDDALTLQFQRGSALLIFEDGSSLNLEPTNFATLTRLDVSADAPLAERGFMAVRTNV